MANGNGPVDVSKLVLSAIQVTAIVIAAVGATWWLSNELGAIDKRMSIGFQRINGSVQRNSQRIGDMEKKIVGRSRHGFHKWHAAALSRALCEVIENINGKRVQANECPDPYRMGVRDTTP